VEVDDEAKARPGRVGEANSSCSVTRRPGLATWNCATKALTSSRPAHGPRQRGVEDDVGVVDRVEQRVVVGAQGADEAPRQVCLLGTA
jgi:hypothetical protein